MSTLLALPRELRNQIYENLFEPTSEDNARFVVPFTTVDKFTCIAPALLNTNQQIADEATPYFLRSRLLVLHNAKAIEDLTAWVSNLPENAGFHAILRVEFVLEGDDVWAAYKLIEACPNLRVVHFCTAGVYECVYGALTLYRKTHRDIMRVLGRPTLQRFAFYLLLPCSKDEEPEMLSYMEGQFLKKWLGKSWAGKGSLWADWAPEGSTCKAGGDDE